MGVCGGKVERKKREIRGVDEGKIKDGLTVRGK